MLQPQVLPISFQGGLASKTDGVQVQLPNLLSLENAKFDKVGALNKRPGYNILGKSITTDGQITSAIAVDQFNNEICLFDNVNVYTYIDAIDSWSNRGPAISLINTNYKIVDVANAQQLNPDCAFLNNIKVFAYEDSRGGVRYCVIDALTSAYVISDLPIFGALSKPKLLVFNNLIYLFYTSNNNLFYQTINPNNPSIISNEFNIASDGYDNFSYDVCVNPAQGSSLIYVVYQNDLGEIAAFDFNASGVISDYTIISSGSQAIQNIDFLAVSLVPDSTAKNWISWSNGAEVYTSAYAAADFSPILIATFVDGIIDGELKCPIVTGLESINLGSLQIIYEVHNDISSNESVRSKIIQTDGTIINIGQLLSVGLAAKPYRQGQDIFINLAYQSFGTQYFTNGPIIPLQNTYFTALLTNVPFTIVSKVAAGSAGGLRTNHMLSETIRISPGIFLWANLTQNKLISENLITLSLNGVNATTIDYADINKFNSVTFSNNLLFVGGILQSYDGVQVVEQNFNVFPEDITFIILSGQGALSEGQYQYQIVYAWNDKSGQTQYSTPSPALTVDVGTNDAVSFQLPTLRLTAKPNVIIQVYRTQVNGSVFQLVTSNISPVSNNITVNTVNFTDALADIEIVNNAPIYTTGGFLPNSAPPSCSMISLYNNRVIIGGLEDQNLLWFSKNKVDNSNSNTIPVEFTSFNTISVNQLGGPITGLGLMDSNLIIFKKNAIFVMNGDGTNDLGGGTPFTDPQLISQSVGCINQGSIILTTTGIMFQSPNKGVWMLPRSLGEPVYIGAGVDTEAKTFIISSSNLDPNSNSVIFTTFDGPALIFDYFVNQWSTWTNHKAVDGVIFNGEFTFVKENGSVYQQDQNIFYDGYVAGRAIPYSLEMTTPWLALANNLGYQAIFRFFILGEYRGAHTLQIAVSYDWNPAFTNMASFVPTLLPGSNVWGSGVNWGTPSPWGGEWSPYVFQVNCTRQKCSSIRIKINDSQTALFNEGFTLNNLLLEVGLFNGGTRIPATNKVSI